MPKSPPPRPRPAPPREPGEFPRFNTKLVEALALIAKMHDLSEVVVDHDGLHIKVGRQMTAAAAPMAHAAPPAQPQSAPAALPAPAAPAAADHPGAVKSPMVGTAYRRPSPDTAAFVEIGAQVKAGDKILLVEAMKTFNEIVAPRAGTVTAILVEDGQPVEYGQALLVLE